MMPRFLAKFDTCKFSQQEAGETVVDNHQLLDPYAWERGDSRPTLSFPLNHICLTHIGNQMWTIILLVPESYCTHLWVQDYADGMGH